MDMTESKQKEKEKNQKDLQNESLSEEDEIIRIHCAENDDGC